MHVDIDRLRPVTPRLIAKTTISSFGINGPGRMFSHEPQERLAVEPSDRVLEIRFGGGETLHRLIEKAGFVVGLDRSSDVIRRVKSKFSLAVSGNIE